MSLLAKKSGCDDGGLSVIDIKALIFQAMVDTGRMSKTDRIEIVEYIHFNEYARVGITAFHARKEKPFQYWNLCIDTVNKDVVWETTTHYDI